jgi:hypothetical protein
MVPQSAQIIPEPIQFYRKSNDVSAPDQEAGCNRLSVQTTSGQAYAATRQLAGHTGLAGLAGHASLTGNAYFAGHAKCAVLGNLARLRTSGT